MKLTIWLVVLGFVFLVLTLSGMFLYGYLDSINHWSLEGVKAVNVTFALATVGAFWLSFVEMPEVSDETTD